MSLKKDAARLKIEQKLANILTSPVEEKVASQSTSGGALTLSDELEKLANEMEKETQMESGAEPEKTPEPAPEKKEEVVTPAPEKMEEVTTPAPEPEKKEETVTEPKKEEPVTQEAPPKAEDAGEGTSSKPEEEVTEEKVKEANKIAIAKLIEFQEYVQAKVASIPAMSKALAAGGLLGSGGIGAFLGHKVTDSGDEQENAQIAQQMYEMGQMSILDQLGGYTDEY